MTSRSKATAYAVAGAASVVALIAATSALSRDEAPTTPLVLAGGVPEPGAPISAAPTPRHQAGATTKPAQAPQDAYAQWAARTGPATGVPARALMAYAAVQARLAREQPDCHLGWPTLAGIGYVESHNGDLGGGLLSSGRPLQRIVGVALDGSGAVASVADTDDGLLDGDNTTDRAVGPMQFLPTSWEAYAADGDGDGVEDPQDIDDAALAAGRYLCVSADLSTAEGWSAAILSYNHSDEYLDAVSTASNTFADRSTS